MNRASSLVSGAKAVVFRRTTAGRRLFNRTTEPKVGDLVLETSRLRMLEDGPSGLGILESVSGDPKSHLAEWTIKTPKGSVRWTNAKFVAIPEGFDWFPRRAAE